MRVLLSTIGSRGDVQPLVALAARLVGSGHEVRVCAPPDFGDWIAGLGFPFVPIGPPLRGTATKPVGPPPSARDRRRMIEETVATQFATITVAADGCDVLVACTALQVGARSVAEHLGIRYVYASYCPVALPSPHHAPPMTVAAADNATLWEQDVRRWNELWGDTLNAHRESLGLPPVSDVRGHMFTDRPWLAADPVLGPWLADDGVVQTGAWLLPDTRPLPDDLTAFLAAGEPPVYFGFGSMRAPADVGEAITAAARAVGRRVIVSRGWADLSVVDAFSVGEVNQRALFGQVAAVVHHGGAGTTTTAALAGAPQVVVPRVYDQFYWATRVADLGIGSAHSPAAPTAESLTQALERALEPETAARATAVAPDIRTDGAATAARLLGTA